MKKLVVFLLLAAVIGVGYMNREALMARFSHPEEKPLEDIEVPVANKSGATLNPATESRAAALRAYPALGQKESIFNKTFLVLYSQAQQREPELLTRPDWPMTLAKRTSTSLTLATPPPVAQIPQLTPKPLQGSALDKHPGKPHK